MAPKIPQLEEWVRLSEFFGFDLSPEKLTEMSAISGPIFEDYGRLDALPDEILPITYPRTDTGYRPEGLDNPHNGWAWKCSIRGADDGKLAGKRVGIKDHTSVAGIPMTNGTSLLEGFVPNEDATVVSRILEAGGEIVGKTAVPAFCFDGASITSDFGPQPTNPHSDAHCAGGSSAGSAIVVLTGQADMAIGGDNGGSIRIPSSWSGCYGLKPTVGLVPMTGSLSIEMTTEHLGPMARTVEDCALLLEVIAGADGLDPRQSRDITTSDFVAGLRDDMKGLRVGIVSEGFGRLGMSENDVDEIVRDAAHRFSKAGATVEEISVPMHLDGPAIWGAINVEGGTYKMVTGDGVGTNWRGHYATGLADFYGNTRRTKARDFPDTVKLVAMIGRYMSENHNHHYYAKGQNLSRRLRAAYDDALSQYDVLIMPTTPMKAMPFPADDSLATYFSTTLGMLANVDPFNVSGHPAMSVPCGTSDGLPVGMQIIGKHFDDGMVLRAAYTFQQNLST
jgi:amidase